MSGQNRDSIFPDGRDPRGHDQWSEPSVDDDPLVELARLVAGETRAGADHLDIEDALFAELNDDLPAVDDLGALADLPQDLEPSFDHGEQPEPAFADVDEEEILYEENPLLTPAAGSLAAPLFPQAPAPRRTTPAVDLAGPVDLDEVAARIRQDEDDPRDADMGVLPSHDPDPEERPAPRRGLRLVGAVLGVVLVGMAVVAAVGFLGGEDETGAPRIVRAPDGAIRETAAVTASDEPRPGQAVFDRLEGQGTETQPRVVLPGPGTSATRPTPGNPATPAQPLAPPTVQPSTQASATPTQPPAPRQVRTVTVRPDGTVVEVETPETAPAAPQPETVADRLASAPAPVAPRDDLPRPQDAAAATTAPAPVAPPAATLAPATPQPVAPAPTARPATPAPAPAVVATAPAAPASLTPPAAPATPASVTPQAAAAAGGFVVQLASLRSEDQARATFANLQRRFTGELASQNPDIARVDLGERGIYYRLRVGPMSREEATARCERLKGQGGDCIVQRY